MLFSIIWGLFALCGAHFTLVSRVFPGVGGVIRNCGIMWGSSGEKAGSLTKTLSFLRLAESCKQLNVSLMHICTCEQPFPRFS